MEFEKIARQRTFLNKFPHIKALQSPAEKRNAKVKKTN
jgi:hypothetical protein